jgi:hypothetical protein
LLTELTRRIRVCLIIIVLNQKLISYKTTIVTKHRRLKSQKKSGRYRRRWAKFLTKLHITRILKICSTSKRCRISFGVHSIPQKWSILIWVTVHIRKLLRHVSMNQSHKMSREFLTIRIKSHLFILSYGKIK